MTLERIVRPFQTGDISPSKPRPISEATAEQNNVVINPGHAGTVKSFSGNYNLTVTFYFIKKPRELRAAGGYDPYSRAGYDDGSRNQSTAQQAQANQSIPNQ